MPAATRPNPPPAGMDWLTGADSPTGNSEEDAFDLPDEGAKPPKPAAAGRRGGAAAGGTTAANPAAAAKPMAKPKPAAAEPEPTPTPAGRRGAPAGGGGGGGGGWDLKLPPKRVDPEGEPRTEEV